MNEIIKPITPEEFEKRMKKIAEDSDPEGGHIDMDNLICEVLHSLGYCAGADIFENFSKWYA